MNGLEAVTDVGQCARDDDRHRVLEEGCLHLLAHVGGLDSAAMDVLEVDAGAGLVRDGMGQAAAGDARDRLGVDVLEVVVGQVVVIVDVLDVALPLAKEAPAP